jgi:dihydrofolate reductase
VVLTRDPGFQAEGVALARSLDEALALGQDLARTHGADAVVIGGGADLYAQTLSLCERLHLTFVHAEPEGDAVFPEFVRSEWEQTASSSHPAGPNDEHPFTFLDLKRCI